MSSKDHLPSHIKYRLSTNKERFLKPFYRLTAAKRALPDFVIIGAARSGTTHFFYTLKQHTQIMTCRVKEISFFNKNRKYSKGENEYRSFFPFASAVPEGNVLGEATPQYMSDDKAPARLAEMLPDAKLIALLRNPTERTISQYFYNLQKNRAQHETRTLEEMVLESDDFMTDPFFTRSIYVDQLKKFDSYKQAGKLLVLRSEDLFKNRDAVLKETCAFLGVDPEFEFEMHKSKNASIHKKEVDPRVKERLNEFYAPHNKRLEEYLGRDMGWN